MTISPKIFLLNEIKLAVSLKASELLTMWINEEVIVPRRNADTGVSNQAPFLWVRAVSHSLELLPELVARGLVPQSIVDSQRAKHNGSLNPLMGRLYAHHMSERSFCNS